jgi:hypothetical protein
LGEQNGPGVPGKEQRIEIPSLFSSLRPVWIVLLDEIAAKRMKNKKDFNPFSFRLYAIHPHGRLPKPPFQIFAKRQKGRVSLSLWITVFFFVYVVSSLSTQYKHPLSSGPD